MSSLALYLLGPPRVERDGEPVTIDRRKALALLAYLAITGQEHRRDTLATLLWPELDQSRARAGLRNALMSLRKALGEGWLDVDREIVRLPREADPSMGSGRVVWLDVDEFQDRLAECQTHDHLPAQVCPDCLSSLAKATELYRDDFLAGFTLADSPSFDDWQFFETQALRDQLASALERLARGHGAQGEYETAVAHARRWVALDPLHEPAHRLLMQLHAWSGQRAAALRQYAECERVLEEEVGAPPEEETVQLFQAIQERQALPPPVDRAAPPITAEAPATKPNLPVQPTPFVGREAALAEIVERLQDPACRLLTLVGPGGSGKTRLALEAAAAQLDRYRHGVYFVSLAPLDAVEAIVPTVAEALDFSFYEGTEPQQQLLDFLSQKAMLLILDNFEHLLTCPEPVEGACPELVEGPGRRDGVGLVTEMLKTAPQVTILATSRTRLNVQGEHLFPVPGMDVPDWETPRAWPEEATRRIRSVRDASQYSAVKLFLQGARRAQPDFELTDNNLTGVVQVCRLVEGMPLGILLAAAWMGMLTPAEIAAEIGQSLDFLETDLRDVPARQRSMRAVFDHSWRLLTEREREVFQRLSVFRGGFTCQAAQRITGASLRELRALVDKSLLQRAPSPDGRYTIHELLRGYAAGQLGDVPAEEEAAKERHCAYYARFLQAREAHLMGRDQKKALAEIEAEIENVRAGWNWAVAQGKLEEMDRALESLTEFYWIRGWFQQGTDTFARAAHRLADAQEAITHRESRIVLGKVLLQQGRFCDLLGLVEQASGPLQKSLAIFRDLDAQREMAYALRWLGHNASSPGEQKRLYQEALAIFKEIGDRKGILLSLWGLGHAAASQGEHGAAKQLYQESLAVARELGNQQGVADSLNYLGNTTRYLGQYGVAKQLHQESSALYKEISDSWGIAYSLNSLAQDAKGLGEYGEAKQLLQESLATYREIGNPRGIARVLANLGEVANAVRDYEGAAQHAGESLALSKRLDMPEFRPWASRVLGEAMCGLGDFQRARTCFYQALETTMMVGQMSQLLLALVGTAILLAAEGERERALELLALALHHPASLQWAKDRATSLVTELEAELSPDVAAAALERGRTRDLEATVAKLLDELEAKVGKYP